MPTPHERLTVECSVHQSGYRSRHPAPQGLLGTRLEVSCDHHQPVARLPRVWPSRDGPRIGSSMPLRFPVRSSRSVSNGIPRCTQWTPACSPTPFRWRSSSTVIESRKLGRDSHSAQCDQSRRRADAHHGRLEERSGVDGRVERTQSCLRELSRSVPGRSSQAAGSCRGHGVRRHRSARGSGSAQPRGTGSGNARWELSNLRNLLTYHAASPEWLAGQQIPVPAGRAMPMHIAVRR